MTAGVSIPKVLFLGHDSRRSGAPLVLLELLRGLVTTGSIDPVLLLANSGDLTAEYERLLPVRIADFVPPRWLAALHQAGMSGLSERITGARVRAIRREYGDVDLIYANSVASAHAISALAPLEVPIICHVHELDDAVSMLLNSRQRDALVRTVTHFIAVSDAVREMLVERLLVDPDHVSVIHPVRPTRSPHHGDDSGDVTAAAPGTLVVTGCGSPVHTKGTDLFIRVAAMVRDGLSAPIRFVWLGLPAGTRERHNLEEEVRRAGLAGTVQFLDPVRDPSALFRRTDLFLSTSRQDSYPLVVMELASLGKPIVCFAESGGAPEFLSDGCGVVVSYLDVEAMAYAAIELLRSPVKRERLGHKARVREGLRGPAEMANETTSLLNRVLADKSGAIHG